MKKLTLVAILILVSSNAFAINCKLAVKNQTIDLKVIKQDKMTALYYAELSGFAASYQVDAGANTETIALAHEDGPNSLVEYRRNANWKMALDLNAGANSSASVLCYNQAAPKR